MKACYCLDRASFDSIYPPTVRAQIARRVDVVEPVLDHAHWRQASAEARAAEVLLSGWGMPPLDADFLAQFPNLRLVLYGAGSIRGFVTPESWGRGVRVVSAAAVNGECVAEFVLGQVLVSLKQVWRTSRAFRESGDNGSQSGITGNYGATVGLISLGVIGRRVAQHLRSFHHHVIAYDPFTRPEDAAPLGVTLVGLDEVFRAADVVSLHTPLLPETVGMIRRAHFDQMRPGATFINTARGAIIHEAEMAAFLADRPDVTALLDVTDPEPPAPDSPLRHLGNVWRTPHVAGCLGPECGRMGQLMADELARYRAGAPLAHEVTAEAARTRA